MAEYDLQFIKDDINRNIRDIELKLLTLLDLKETKLSKEISTLKTQVKDVIEKNKINLENFSIQNIDHQKLIELEKFKKKTESTLISHNIRINNNFDDLLKSKNKYDKVICENLILNGLIGPGCPYKNIADCVYGTVNDISKFKVEKEALRKDVKEVKTKMDGLLKQIIMINDTTLERANQYTNIRQKDLEKNLDFKLEEFMEKIKEIRAISSKIQMDCDEKMKNLDDQFQTLIKMKEDLEKMMDEKIHEVHKKVVINIQDIGICKKKIINNFNEINQDMKPKITELEDKINKLEKSNQSNLIKDKNKIFRHPNAMKSVKLYHSPNILHSLRYRKNKEKVFNSGSDSDDTQKSGKRIIGANLYESARKRKDNNEKPKNNEQEKNIIDLKFVDSYSDSSDIKEKDKSKEIIPPAPKETKVSRRKSLNHKEIINLNNNPNQIQKQKDTKIMINSFDNYFSNSANIMPLISEPEILEQKILNDEELNKRQEKYSPNVEVKTKMKKNLINLRKVNKMDILDLYNFSTSVPLKLPPPNNTHLNIKTISEPNVDLIKNFGVEKNMKFENNVNKKRTKKIKFDSQSQVRDMKDFKYINLELEKSTSINQDMNNGAYVLAHANDINNKISSLKQVPTSYFQITEVINGKKNTKLMNLTFEKEVVQRDKMTYLKSLYNVNNNIKNNGIV